MFLIMNQTSINLSADQDQPSTKFTLEVLTLTYKLLVSMLILIVNTLVIVVQLCSSSFTERVQPTLMVWLGAVAIVRTLASNPLDMAADYLDFLPLPSVACRTRGYLFDSLVTVYLYISVLLCADRFVAVFFPIAYRVRASAKLAHLSCAVVTVLWFAVHAAIELRPVVAMYPILPIVGYGYCFFKYSAAEAFLYLLHDAFWTVPLILIIVLNAMTLMKAIRMKLRSGRVGVEGASNTARRSDRWPSILKTVKETEHRSKSEQDHSSESRSSRNMRTLRGVLMVTAQMVMLLLFWTPSYYLLVVNFIKGDLIQSVPNFVLFLGYWLRQADSITNGIIYLRMDTDSKQTIRRWKDRMSAFLKR